MKERFLGGRKTKWIELLGFVYISGFQGERKKERNGERENKGEETMYLEKECKEGKKKAKKKKAKANPIK